MSETANDRQELGDSEDFACLLAEARGGSREAIGALIEACRPYLLLVANQDLDKGLKAKLGASDVVQESILSAQNHIADFRGQTQGDLVAWLRGILINDLLATRRRFRGTAKRQIDREVAWVGNHDSVSGAQVDIPSHSATPGTQVAAEEEAAALHAAMARLSPEYREVLELRNWQQLSFGEIGQKMGRTAEAVRKLWSRALVQLQRELEFHVGQESSTK